jgi:ABC-type sugar transport system permease subunit
MANEIHTSTTTQEEKPASSVSEKSPIDFKGVSALSQSSYEPEPWYVSLGWTLLDWLISLGLFFLGLILDIFKALWNVIRGFFVGIVKGAVGIGRYFRNQYRMLVEGDGFVKGSFFIWGLGNFSGKQYVQGGIFLGAELLIIAYFAFGGVTSITNLIFIGEASAGQELPNLTSVGYLISGIVAVVMIAALVYLWNVELHSAYDNYVIRHNFYFLQARQDALLVAKNYSNFPAIYTSKKAVAKDGSSYTKIKFFNHWKIRKIMREVYGFSKLSSRYISYLPFKRLLNRSASAFSSRFVGFFYGIGDRMYAHYAKLRDKIKAGKFSSLFGDFLLWQPFKHVERYGQSVVVGEAEASINKFRHTYDKYNDYLAYVRDTNSLLDVLSQPQVLEDAIFARDSFSKKNGLSPLDFSDPKLKIDPKTAASRVIAAFECSYNDAVSAAGFYLRARKDQAKTGVEPKAKIMAIRDALLKQRDAFIDKNNTRLLRGVHGVENALRSFKTYYPDFQQGKASFVSVLVQKEGCSSTQAEAVYSDYALAIRLSKDDETQSAALLNQMADRYHPLAVTFETYPFHGRPIIFKKNIKRYADEKFAVTVLSLPTIAALITVIIPLIFSIIIAFTNWNYPRTSYGNFDWDFESWLKVTDLGGGENYTGTFMYILGWTIVWAFFATFTNYLFGIILALLINKKGIRLKKMWRTIFVITVAIPQFITLLAMRKILGDGGPISTWFYEKGWVSSLGTFWLNDQAHHGLSAKITLIVVNMWIGIPYTMLSTSGILMNIPEDLYESARIDGASPWTQFWKITMPYILFVTGPSLLTSFIGNINNFNVIYFLTGGGPASDGSIVLANNAQYTDLLITWLYKMTVTASKPTYGVGSCLGILIFVICAFFSLIIYSRLGSTKNEEEFQ